MTQVFVSYNREAHEAAHAVATDLRAMGHDVWLDEELSGGQSWWDQILEKVRRTDLFVFILQQAALDSAACQREYEYASALGKPILPLLVSDDISINLLPPALTAIQYVDYRTADRDAALQLARAITTVPPAGPLPDLLPDPPKVPLSYLGGLAQQVETAGVLSYEDQSALLVDLKRGLRSNETRSDARRLLLRLRDRRDLLASIAFEIDDAMRAAEAPKSPEPAKPKRAETVSPVAEVTGGEHLPSKQSISAQLSPDTSGATPLVTPRRETLAPQDEDGEDGPKLWGRTALVVGLALTATLAAVAFALVDRGDEPGVTTVASTSLVTTASPPTTAPPTTAPPTTAAPVTVLEPTPPGGFYQVVVPTWFPDPLPGSGGDLGSGCAPGPGPLSDGVWFGFIDETNSSPSTVVFDLACLGSDLLWRNDAETERVVAVHSAAVAWVLDGSGENPELMWYLDWWLDPILYDDCGLYDLCTWGWLYVNDGLVTEVVPITQDD